MILISPRWASIHSGKAFSPGKQPPLSEDTILLLSRSLSPVLYNSEALAKRRIVRNILLMTIVTYAHDAIWVLHLIYILLQISPLYV